MSEQPNIQCRLDAQQCQQECEHKNNREECPFVLPNKSGEQEREVPQELWVNINRGTHGKNKLFEDDVLYIKSPLSKVKTGVIDESNCVEEIVLEYDGDEDLKELASQAGKEQENEGVITKKQIIDIMVESQENIGRSVGPGCNYETYLLPPDYILVARKIMALLSASTPNQSSAIHTGVEEAAKEYSLNEFQVKIGTIGGGGHYAEVDLNEDNRELCEEHFIAGAKWQSGEGVERFKKPTDRQVVKAAILFNDGLIDKKQLSNMVALADFIIDRLYENGEIQIPSSKEK